MKHNVKITIILLSMFVVTQFIGLYVLHADPFHITTVVNGTAQTVSNPALSWIQPPEVEREVDFYKFFVSIVIAFAIAIFLIFLLSKFKAEFFIKLWFFVVVIIALFISLIAIFPKMWGFSIVALIIAIVLGFIKIYKRNFVIHNLTELLVYPGIAAIFVPILNLLTIIIFLIIISIYDMWAVWKSGFMQKMAKYQINKVKIFAGFFVPYISKKQRQMIKKLKKSQLKKKRIRINLAILGGGDIVFPIIAAGVMLKTLGLSYSLFVIFGAALGLTYLFFVAEKKKFYPAMPFITAGIFLGMLLSLLIL